MQPIAADIWAIMVANATPNTDHLHTITNTKSNTTLITLATTKKINGVLESPKALIIADIPLYAATAKIPAQVTCI